MGCASPSCPSSARAQPGSWQCSPSAQRPRLALERAPPLCAAFGRCAGGDLYRRLVRAGGVLSEAEVARDVVVPLLLTLTFLHANNIVHR